MGLGCVPRCTSIAVRRPITYHVVSHEGGREREGEGGRGREREGGREGEGGRGGEGER